MTKLDAKALQDDLLAVFEKHGVSVAVGLIKNGVAIRSQDDRVEAISIGLIKPWAGMRPLLAHRLNDLGVCEDCGAQRPVDHCCPERPA